MNKSVKKRKGKQIKNVFLKQFSQYVLDMPKITNFEVVHDLSHTLREIGQPDKRLNAIKKFVLHCPTFQNWCDFIACTNTNFEIYGKAFGVSWFHSTESLQFVCDMLQTMLQTTNSTQVCGIDVIFGFNEACMRSRGVPILCQTAYCHKASEIPFTFVEQYQEFPPNTNLDVLYIDMRLGMRFQILKPYISQASFIVFAGPTCMLPFLYRTNDALIHTYKFHRCMYNTFGVSADRVVYDGNVSCTCIIVYYRPNMYAHIPQHPVLENPSNILRQHYIRHALSGNIPEYFKWVITNMPLKVFLSILPDDTQTCPFDHMLIDIFGNGHINECEEEEETDVMNLVAQMNIDQTLTQARKSYGAFDTILKNAGLLK